MNHNEQDMFDRLDQLKKGVSMKRKPTATDGFIMLLLLGIAIFFIAWALTDVGWDLLRAAIGVTAFVVAFKFSSQLAKG